jgi:hypothetical protein
MSAALEVQLPGTEKCYQSVSKALVTSPYFSSRDTSKTALEVQLDVQTLLSDAGRVSSSSSSSVQSDYSSNSSSSSGGTSSGNACGGGSQTDADSSNTGGGSTNGGQQLLLAAETDQLQVAAPSQQRSSKSSAWPVMPLPKQLQPLLHVSAADCEAAEIVIVGDQQEQQQHAEQLEAVVQHMRAAGIAALDVEYYWETSHGDSSNSSTISSMSSSDEDDDLVYADAAAAQGLPTSSSSKLPPEHHCFQLRITARGLRLALVQLLVPAADSTAGSWPAAIYLVQVPWEQAAAKQVASQLQSALEDEQIVKVVHDARQVSGHNWCGSCLPGVWRVLCLTGLLCCWQLHRATAIHLQVLTCTRLGCD